MKHRCLMPMFQDAGEPRVPPRAPSLRVAVCAGATATSAVFAVAAIVVCV
jgi:hypothetical protein